MYSGCVFCAVLCVYEWIQTAHCWDLMSADMALHIASVSIPLIKYHINGRSSRSMLLLDLGSERKTGKFLERTVLSKHNDCCACGSRRMRQEWLLCCGQRCICFCRPNNEQTAFWELITAASELEETLQWWGIRETVQWAQPQLR